MWKKKDYEGIIIEDIKFLKYKNLYGWVVKNISLHYNVPTAKSSICQLIDSFESKCFNGVTFVDPFYSFHWAKLKT